MPDRWPRKLSAVRSAVRIDASEPSTARRSSGRAATRRRRRRTTTRLDAVVDLTNVSVAQTRDRPARPASRATNAAPSPATSGGSNAEVRSPSGVRSSARARATASTTADRGGSSTTHVSLPTRRARTAGVACDEPQPDVLVVALGRSRPRACAPRLSSAGAARPPQHRRPDAARGFAAPSTPWLADRALQLAATDAAPRCNGLGERRSPRLSDTPASARSSSAATARAGRRFGSVARLVEQRGDRLGTRRPPADDARPRPDDRASTARMAPVGSGSRFPRSMASTTRVPNTMPSSSEFDASRLAPCTPEHATSPAAHRPGRTAAPSRSVTTPPQK